MGRMLEQTRWATHGRCQLGAALLALVMVGCGGSGGDGTSDPDGPDGGGSSGELTPMLIPGGGVGSGAIAGTVHVHVIDASTGTPIEGATVLVSSHTGATGSDGLATIEDAALSGAQTVSASAPGYAAATFFGANGGNVTIPLESAQKQLATARVTGNVDGWSNLPDPPNFSTTDYNLGVILYSHTADIGAPENTLEQAVDGDGVPLNTCVDTAFDSGPCNWQLTARTGRQLQYALLLRGDTNGADDIAQHDFEVLGYAFGSPGEVSGDASGVALQVDQSVTTSSLTVSFPAPIGLSSIVALPYIDSGDDGQLVFPFPQLAPQRTSTEVPALAGRFASASYQIVGLATNGTDNVPFSASIVREAGASTTLPAWLALPADLTGSGDSFSFSAPGDATLVTATFRSAQGQTQWNVTILDGTQTIGVPADLAPLADGALDFHVIAYDIPGFDPRSFRIRDYGDQLSRISEAKARVSR